MGGNYDLLVLGGGVCGMTAAIYAARASLSVCIIEKEVCGGLVNWTHTVENMPSHKSIHGMDLMALCRDQADALGVDIAEISEAGSVELAGPVKKVRPATGEIFTGKAVILATGRKPVQLPVQTDFENVHYCSICDGTAYKGKDVLVVGGGNSGFDESLYLAGLGVRSIHIIEVFPACIAAMSVQERARETGLVRVSCNTRLTSLEPLPSGCGLAALLNSESGEESREEFDGVFCFIGQKPNTKIFEGLLEMDRGYIVTDENMGTKIPGVFAAGDVRSKKYRQITTAMGDGTIAAMEAEYFIRSNRF